MTQQPIALLELALVGGLGAILFITGILIKTLTDRKNSRCTSKTVGKVIRHSFKGMGRRKGISACQEGDHVEYASARAGAMACWV